MKNFWKRDIIVVESGALNDRNDPYRKKRENHAEKYYESVRKRDKNIEIKNILSSLLKFKETEHFTYKDVEKVYNHIFIKKYKLNKGYKNFDPDYDMSQSWQRLREGKNIKKHDLIMVLHEKLEYEYMNVEKLEYDEAHKRTNEKYDYFCELTKWLKERSEK